MFQSMKRSWRLAGMSFEVVRRDPELLLFPLLAALASGVVMVVGLLPSGVFSLLATGGGHQGLSWLGTVGMVVTYVGVTAVATFFNACVVHTARVRLDGGHATFMDSIHFAVSRLHRIMAWALVAATVGLLLRAVENTGRRLGPLGGLFLRLVATLVGGTWAAITLFVVPVMVCEDVGPQDAIRRSAQLLERTWGESILGFVGLGWMHAVVVVFGLSFGMAATVFLGMANLPPQAMVVSVLGTVMLVVGASLVFSMTGRVYVTALYAYATTGKAPAPFREDDLWHSARHKSGMGGTRRPPG